MPAPPPPKPGTAGAQAPFACPLHDCPRRLHTLGKLLQHVRGEARKDPAHHAVFGGTLLGALGALRCDRCDGWYANEAALKRHRAQCDSRRQAEAEDAANGGSPPLVLTSLADSLAAMPADRFMDLYTAPKHRGNVYDFRGAAVSVAARTQRVLEAMHRLIEDRPGDEGPMRLYSLLPTLLWLDPLGEAARADAEAAADSRPPRAGRPRGGARAKRAFAAKARVDSVLTARLTMLEEGRGEDLLAAAEQTAARISEEDVTAREHEHDVEVDRRGLVHRAKLCVQRMAAGKARQLLTSHGMCPMYPTTVERFRDLCPPMPPVAIPVSPPSAAAAPSPGRAAADGGGHGGGGSGAQSESCEEEGGPPPPAPPDPPKEWEFSLDVVQRTLRDLAKEKTSGVDGWLLDHYTRLYVGNQGLTEALARMIRLYVRGRMHRAAYPVLSIVEGMAAFKTAAKSRDEIRPLGVPTAFTRIAGRVMVAQDRRRLRDAAGPWQFAIAEPGGCDLLGHALQALAEAMPEWVFLSLDIQNAFNTVFWDAVEAEIATHFPEWLTLFRLTYRQEEAPRCFLVRPTQDPAVWARDREDLTAHVAALRAARRDGRPLPEAPPPAPRDPVPARVLIPMRRGLVQGDPLSGPLFALAIAPAIAAVAARFPDEVAAFFADDGTLGGPEDRIGGEGGMMRAAERALGERGCVVRPRKYRVFSPRPVRADGSDRLRWFREAGIRVGDPVRPGDAPREDLLVVVGVPIGSRAAQEAYLAELVEQHAALGRRIADVAFQEAAVLLRMCQGPRLVYWLRCLPPAVTEDAAGAADLHAQRVFECLLAGGGGSRASWDDPLPPSPALPERSVEILFRPCRIGAGGGLTCAARVRHSAYLGSLALTLPRLMARVSGHSVARAAIASAFAASSQSPLARGLEESLSVLRAAQDAVRGGRCLMPDGIIPAADALEDLPLPTAAETIAGDGEGGGRRRLQHLATTVLHAASYVRTFTTADPADRAFFVSTAGAPAGGLVDCMPYDAHRRASHAAMVAVWRARLRLPYLRFTPDSPMVLRCTCRARVAHDVFGVHALTCPAGGGPTFCVHDAVVRALGDAAHRFGHYAVGEDYPYLGAAGRRPCDLVLYGAEFGLAVVDVGVVHPECATHRARAGAEVGGAAAAGQGRKRDDHASACRAAGISEFYGAAIETHGAPSEDLTRLVSFLARPAATVGPYCGIGLTPDAAVGRARRWIWEVVVCALQRGVAECVLRAERHATRALRQQGVRGGPAADSGAAAEGGDHGDRGEALGGAGSGMGAGTSSGSASGLGSGSAFGAAAAASGSPFFLPSRRTQLGGSASRGALAGARGSRRMQRYVFGVDARACDFSGGAFVPRGG